MKVIHLISGGDTGGAKTHILSLLQNLGRVITVQLVCFRDGPFAEEARQLGIPTEVMPGNRIFRIRRRLVDYIREGGYDLIHCHGSRANMIGALLRGVTELPVVTTVHSDYRIDYLGRPLSRLTFGTINALALRRLDYRIGVSDTITELLTARGFSPDRLYTIYSGLDFSPAPDQGDRVEYLRSLGADVDEDSVVVGIAGRLNPVKDMSTLLRGFAAGYAQCPRLRLIIAGDGEEREKLTALAKELGVEKQATFAGWISGGMDRFYAALDINAITSLSEGFPYVLPEGARFHLATVATAVGGIPRLIDNGVNGYLFQPGDSAELGRLFAALGSDDELRRSIGDRLYEKASDLCSIQSMVNTQLRIYEDILRRGRPGQSRNGVVICGAYGLGNAGDEAILNAILQQVRSAAPEAEITVLSRNPKETAAAHGVDARFMFNIPGVQRAMRNARLYINGGGTLIQDVTSRRSLWYYLYTLSAAKKRGCQVLMYGCGIGPVTKKKDVSLAAGVLNRSVDAITLREPDSLEQLKAMGVTKPEVLLTADPALTLSPGEDTDIDAVLERAGIPAGGRWIGFALRRWKGFDQRAELFAQAARYAYEAHGLTPVFISVENRLDPAACRLAARSLSIPHYFVDDAAGAGALIGVLSRMDVVVSMRLHALIFAAGQGVPLAGVVYDPKVSSFLRYIGQDQFMDLEDLTADGLKAMIDRCVERRAHPEEQRAAIRKLRDLEHGNELMMKKLLDRT